MRFLKNRKFLSVMLSWGLWANIVAPSAILAKQNVETSETVKVSQDIVRLIESGESEIPVVVWNKSIPDSNVEKMVKNKIGFSIEELEKSYVPPSDNLIKELSVASKGSPREHLEKLMKQHMNITAESRRLELEDTDLYINTRRSVISEYYTKSSNEFITDAKLSESSIIFASKYSPMIVCKLNPDEIKRLSERDDVEEIIPYENLEVVDCSFPNTNMKETMGINTINQFLNLTGENVKIGIYETATVSSQYNDYDLDMSKVTIIEEEYLPPNKPYHATWCASVAAGNYGVAPDATIYSATVENDYCSFNWNSENNTLPALESLISNGIKIINISWAASNNESCYNYWTKYTDYLISHNKVTMVCATGNSYEDFIAFPSSAYNCIAVNAFLKSNNEEIICNYSYLNGDGCQKPDVIAQTFGLGGTSTATPVITGMMALLFQYKPSLSAHPELAKAILMASCHRKAYRVYTSSNTIMPLNETLAEGLSEHQGAGIPNMYTMISIASQHSYGSGVLSSNETTINFIQPKYGSTNMNLAMAYSQNNVGVTNSNSIDDYDIELTSGNVKKSSKKSRSSTELIYTNLFSTDNKYQLKIKKNSGSSSEITYGYAWSTDQAKFIPTLEEEGVYYLKNKSTNSYMTFDSSNSRCLQNSFSGNNNQTWVIKYNPSNGKYVLQSASGNKFGMKMGDTISGAYQIVTEGNSADVLPVVVRFNDDGTYSFTINTEYGRMALGAYQNYVAWYPYNSSNSSQKWYMESLQWRRGDVNMDGYINQTDINVIQSHVNYVSGLTVNIQKFLADANLDGVIDLQDMSYISLGLC